VRRLKQSQRGFLRLTEQRLWTLLWRRTAHQKLRGPTYVNYQLKYKKNICCVVSFKRRR